MQQYSSQQIMAKVAEAVSSQVYDRKPAHLYEPISYVLSLGGKRLRPALMLMAYNLYRDDVDSIMPQAIAIETYHNFTLLHDDVMDKADVRRGKPTVHKVWDENTAILSGDTMLILAMKTMSESNNPNIAEALKLFFTTALEIDEGQQYDMDFETRDDVTENEYLEMIRLKTSVLLACALKIGAILAGVSKDDADNLYSFGEKLGLAFQLQDDLLDVYGDSAVFGKQIGGDIACNKKTYMLINALERADEATRGELEQWISLTSFDREEKVAAVTAIYDRLSIKELCLQRISAFFDEALACLDKVTVDDGVKSVLRSFALSMLHREK